MSGSKLHQVFFPEFMFHNLVANALKYNDKDILRIEIGSPQSRKRRDG